MTGYLGYSMSCNAVKAYEEGKKPFSKFSKNDFYYKNIINFLKKDDFSVNLDTIEDFFVLKKVLKIINKISFKDIKEFIKNDVKPCEWHHTSSHYNITDFYSIKDIVEKIFYWLLGYEKISKSSENILKKYI